MARWRHSPFGRQSRLPPSLLPGVPMPEEAHPALWADRTKQLLPLSLAQACRAEEGAGPKPRTPTRSSPLL